MTVPNHFVTPSRLTIGQVNVFGPAVRDDVGGGLGIAGGQPVFAGMVVTGAGRDHAQRNVAQCQRLQGDGDDAVAAGHHQRVGAAVQRIVDQPSRVFGVGADDFDDVDAPLLKSCDGRSAACGALPWPRRDWSAP